MGDLGKMDMNKTMHMSMMYFKTNTDVYVLFREWHVLTPGHMVAAFIGVFIAAILSEGLKILREFVNYFLNRGLIRIPARAKATGTQSNYEPLLPKGGTSTFNAFPRSNEFIGHVIQSVLQTLQYTIGYLLMLIAMTMNLWLFLAVILGMGTGYFLFGWLKRKIPKNSEEFSSSQDACDCLN